MVRRLNVKEAIIINIFTQDANRRRFVSRAAIVLVIVGIFYLTVSGGITLTTEIPKVFSNYSQDYTALGKRMIFLAKDNSPIYPIIHDEKSLYILNGADDDFKGYYIDQVNQEIVIEKNLVKFFGRGQAHFQLITISNKKYNDIIKGQTVKIRMKYLYEENRTTLLEYNLQDKTSQEI